jgi:hypothetical protein
MTDTFREDLHAFRHASLAQLFHFFHLPTLRMEGAQSSCPRYLPFHSTRTHPQENAGIVPQVGLRPFPPRYVLTNSLLFTDPPIRSIHSVVKYTINIPLAWLILSSLKVHAIRSSETSVTNRLHAVSSQKVASYIYIYIYILHKYSHCHVVNVTRDEFGLVTGRIGHLHS